MDSLAAIIVVAIVLYVLVIKPRLKRGCRSEPHGVRIEPSREAMSGPFAADNPMAWPLLDSQYLNHHGWERIGPVDKAGQRSLWLRLHHEGADCDGYAHDACGYIDDVRTVVRIEIRGGRQGGDFYMKLERKDPAFEQMLNLFTLCRSISSADHLDKVLPAHN